jgi:hypothetical protein
VEEADAELVVVEIIAVTTHFVEEEDAEVEVIAVATQLMEEEEEADTIIVAEMETVTEGIRGGAPPWH